MSALSTFDPIGDLIRLSRPAARRPPPIFTPEEEESILADLGQGALSGIGYVGESLGKPAAALSGLLMGRPEELANVIPFSDALGITSSEGLLGGTPFQVTDDERTVYGGDVLEHYGVLPPNREGFDWADIPRLAGDVLVDPLLPFTFGAGALTKGGQSLRSAGLLEDALRVAGRSGLGRRAARVGMTVGDALSGVTDDALRGVFGPHLPGAEAARSITNPVMRDTFQKAARLAEELPQERLAETLGGFAGFGVPFGAPSRVLGTGGRSGRALSYLDRLGEAARYSAPGRTLASLMSAPAKGPATELGQKIGKTLYSREPAATAHARKFVGRQAEELLSRGLLSDEDASILRSMAEGTAKQADEIAELRPMVGRIHSELREILRLSDDYGLKADELFDDHIENYFPRAAARAAPGAGSRGGRPLTVLEGSQLARKPFLRDIQGGTERIREIIRDGELNRLIDDGHSLKDITEELSTRYGDDFTDTDSIPRFANWMAGLSQASRDVGVFGNHPLADLGVYLTRRRQAIEAAETIYDALSSPEARRYVSRYAEGAAKPARDIGTVSIRSFFKNARIRSQRGIEQLARRTGLPAEEVAQWRIPENLANDVGGLLEGFQSPRAVNVIVDTIDSVTNLFKTGVTSIWPAFHTRNLLSGQFMNFVAGMFSGRSVYDANRVLAGKVVSGAAEIPALRRRLIESGVPPAGLTDEAATSELRRLLYEHDVAGRYQGEALNVSGQVQQQLGTGAESITGNIPGLEPFEWTQVARRAAGREPGTTLNLLAARIRGVAGAAESNLGPVAAGQDFGHFIEGLNRISPFIAQLRKGVDPGYAARKIAAAQVEYGARAYTAFERGILQRVFPFYKFSSRILPYTLRELIERPGGRLAQTIKASAQAQGSTVDTPEYVAQTASIPVGEIDDGSMRYLTGFGLMHEDPLAFIGGGVQGGLIELASRSNPLLKAPAEWAAGESFFQRGPMGGRDIDDLDPTVGRLLANISGRDEPVPTPRSAEFVLANSPLARLLTSARTLTDRRKGALGKGLNLLTGARVSDVSPAAQDALVRERAQAEMNRLGARAFTRYYFPKEELEALPEGEEREARERLQAFINLLARKAKERKRQKKGR